MAANYDRVREDVSNIVHLEHVNVTVPDQHLATAFYVSALGFTRDPYIMVGTDNMWINIGRSQMHLPTRSPQRMRGTIGLVVPDREPMTPLTAALVREARDVTTLLNQQSATARSVDIKIQSSDRVS